MPRFYFNVWEHGELIEDNEGQEFPSLAEARKKAVQSARELMSEAAFVGKKLPDDRFEVADEFGHLERSPIGLNRRPNLVVPAKAGSQGRKTCVCPDSRLRRNDNY